MQYYVHYVLLNSCIALSGVVLSHSPPPPHPTPPLCAALTVIVSADHGYGSTRKVTGPTYPASMTLSLMLSLVTLNACNFVCVVNRH